MCVNKSNGRATIMNIQAKPGFFSEDIMLDISTRSCHISSSAVVAENDMPWDAYISECCEKEIVYYVDQEQFRLQMQPENILRELKASGICSFHFRVNSGADFDWAAMTAVTAESSGEHITKVRLTARNQNNFCLNGNGIDEGIIREMLFNGFGRVYSNTIWIDVLADKYIVQNLYGDDCREEMPSKPTGSYSVDNLGYSVNFVYPDDQETFNKFTSLDWYKNNLNKEGVKFSFRIRHTCNGEYRWVEVNVVCTRHTG